MILGAIGDDFTGSSDLGLMLAAEGMRTVQYTGVPDTPAGADVEAGIVALKSRSAPVDEAVAASLAALTWLRAQGAQLIYFKVCSTFDSTPEGNIGPVAEALREAMGSEAPVLVCPAFPATGRTVFQGHLFVGDKLLSESGMENHPLNPMTDPDLRRWLARQTSLGVGHLPLAAQRGDAMAALTAEAMAGRPFVVADAVDDDDLRAMGPVAARLDLVVGGSGLALGLPAALGAAGGEHAWRGETGATLALCGSCSSASRAQVQVHASSGSPVLQLDPAVVMARDVDAETLVAQALGAGGVPLIASSASPDAVAAVQAAHGREAVAAALDELFADLARAAVAAGVRRLIVAGGETSGAVVEGLRLQALEIGPAIDPGVPALRAQNGASGQPLVLALKSGNFGARDFFAKAATVLEGGA